MSKEIVGKGNPFKIAYLDRTFGARATDVLTVSEDDGSIEIETETNLKGGLKLDGVAVTTATAIAASIPLTATLTVAAFDTDHHDVTVQLKDAGAVNMAKVCRVDVWLSATAKGTPIGTGTTGLTTTFTTGTLALTKLANLDFEVLSDATGVIVCRVTDTNGTESRYLNVAVNGVVYASAVITSGS